MERASVPFEIKTAEVVELGSGMRRDKEEGKLDYTLIFDGPMVDRWATLLTNAVPTRGERNWMKAHTEEDYKRFRRSASRHFVQWLRGERDEDHASSLFFNVNGAEHVGDQLRGS